MEKNAKFVLPVGTPVLILGFEPIKGYGEYNLFWSDPERFRAGVLAEPYREGSAFLLKDEGFFAANGSIGPRDTRTLQLTCENGSRLVVVQRSKIDERGINLYFVLEDKHSILQGRPGDIPRLAKNAIYAAYCEHVEAVHTMVQGM